MNGSVTWLTSRQATVEAPFGATDVSSDRLLNVSVDQHRHGAAVLSLHGDVDIATARRAQALVCRHASAPTRVLVLDLSPLGFFGTCGIGVLDEVQDYADHQGIDLRLVIDRGSYAERVLTIIGQDRRFSVYRTTSDALI